MLEKLEQIIKETKTKPSGVEEQIPQLFENYKEALIAAAISAEERALHWNKEKPVHVGCSLLALGKNLDLSMPAVYTGANIKELPGDFAYPDRKCGEMVALENITGLNDPKDEENKGEGVEKGDLGLILAIVTVSESFNTGEADTIDHDVLYPCKQCQTNYQFLLDKGVVSEKTVICNLRTKDGKIEKGESITLGEMFEKFRSEKEQRNLKTIGDLLEVEKRATHSYLASVEKITIDIKNQRERTERIFEELEVYSTAVKNALKSAVEEGVSKERIVSSLKLPNIDLDKKTRGFSSAELDLIMEALFKPFLENLPKPIKEKE